MKKVLFIGFLATICLSAQFTPAVVFAMTKCSKQENTDSGCDQGCKGNLEDAQSDVVSKEEKPPQEVKCERKSAAQKVLEKECDM